MRSLPQFEINDFRFQGRSMGTVNSRGSASRGSLRSGPGTKGRTAQWVE